MMNSMKKLLFLAEKINLKDKIGAAFGSYGWSGEAPERIYETMNHIFEMHMPGEPLRIKSPLLEEGVQFVKDYAKSIADMLINKTGG